MSAYSALLSNIKNQLLAHIAKEQATKQVFDQFYLQPQGD